MKVSVSRTINCAHHLPGTDLHGHTYRVTAMLMAPVHVTGYACEFSVLQTTITDICNALDHKRLEPLIGSPATAENLAIHIARAANKAITKLVNVRVEVGDDGTVETDMYERDGEYYSR